MSLKQALDAAAVPRGALGRAARLLQFQAVRIVEQTQQQPLDDVQAMRDVHAAFETAPERLLERAARLAPQIGLTQALAGARERLFLVALLAALLVGLMSYGLVMAVVGHDRRINAMAALVAVLGPHLLSVLLWFFFLLFGSASSGGGLLKRLLDWSARLPILGDPGSRLLLQAALEVMAASRGLTAWAFGCLTHLIWSLAFVFTLLGLLLAFSFLSYQLTWETTILDAQTFAQFAHAAGRLPAFFGFATPAVDHLLEGHGNHRAWAIWLLACTLVYGLGLRLLLAILSGLRAWQLLSSLRLPADSDPYVRRLLQRFEAMQEVQVSDPELPAATGPLGARSAAGHRPGVALLGFELPDQRIWPASGIDQPLLLLARTDGALADTRQLLARLQALAPAHLLLVCNAAASPDRGTARFLRAAASHAAHTAVLLDGAPEHQESARRWRDWLAPLQTEAGIAAVFAEAAEADNWLKESANKGSTKGGKSS